MGALGVNAGLGFGAAGRGSIGVPGTAEALAAGVAGAAAPGAMTWVGGWTRGGADGGGGRSGADGGRTEVSEGAGVPGRKTGG
jgi:hypothetical protein